MIAHAIWAIVVAVLTTVMDVLPSWTAPSTSSGAVAYVGKALQAFGPWVNVPLILSAIGIVAAAVVLAFTVRALLWLYGLLPFKFT
jgi:hypothetical protein